VKTFAELQERDLHLLDAVPSMIWVADTEGRSVFNNTALLAFTGQSCDEARGDGWLKMVHEQDLGHFGTIRSILLRQPRDFYFEFRVRRSDGEYRWVLNQCAPLLRGERFVGFIGVYTDITALKRARAKRGRKGHDPDVLPLAPREFEVLRLIAGGNPIKQIAQILKISAKTVEATLARVRRKTGIRSIAGLTKYAIQHGIVEHWSSPDLVDAP
jgi:PAS domain S-box-containing protein